MSDIREFVCTFRVRAPRTPSEITWPPGMQLIGWSEQSLTNGGTVPAPQTIHVGPGVPPEPIVMP